MKKKALLSPLLNINKFNTNNIDNKNITIFKFILGFIKKNKANNKGVSLAIYEPRILSLPNMPVILCANSGFHPNILYPKYHCIYPSNNTTIKVAEIE